MNTTFGKFVKGFLIGLVPIVLVTLKQHGCTVDNWQSLIEDLGFAVIPGAGHAIFHYITKK